ncbi:MAG: signal peptidase II [Prevotellaceae bacterium]|jgi:hypothetical protein|nr:signal peptidase II [Prevotellaceae bacterium]
MKIRTVILWILALVIIDQAIKIVINSFFLKSGFEIIPSLLEFKPVFNNKYSYVNDLLYEAFHINMGLWLHLVLYLTGEIIALYIYLYFKIKLNNSYIKILGWAIVFQTSGLLCALTGNLFWEKGILDYIYLKPLFVFDLKDIYIDVFICLFLVYVLKNRKQLKGIKLFSRKEIKGVIAYLKNRDDSVTHL